MNAPIKNEVLHGTDRPADAGEPGWTDPLWYKDAIIYQLHVKSFFDANNDGIGDFSGLISKLDYIRELGATAIWLLPFYPSPLLDDGYDISEYRKVNSDYGTMADVRRFIRAAHERGLRVIAELVINHTSDQHPWFKAAQNPNDPHHDWYVWATPQSDLHAISATGGPAWHRAPNGQYYVGVFTSAMPDLNYDNLAVRKEMIDVGRFWLKQGVDGFRLDAAQHIYDDLRSLVKTHLHVLRILKTSK